MTRNFLPLTYNSQEYLEVVKNIAYVRDSGQR